jgi:hypothetical protein
MQQIIQSLQQALLNEHIPNEQVQNIINSVDVSQLDLQNIPETAAYLSQFLAGLGLEENIINHVNSSLADSLGSVGINGLQDLGIDQDGIVGNIQNIFGGLFGAD